MKKFAAFLIAVALLNPAFAQKPTPQLTSPISKLHTVTPAAKPLLLHTGMPLTANDKKQFLAAVIKTVPASVRKPQASSAPPSTITLTPTQTSQGNTYLILQNPGYVNFSDGEFRFINSNSSMLIFIINTQPNTAYLLATQVNIQDYAVNSPAHFIAMASDNNPETFTAAKGNNEFAYGIVSNSTGYLMVMISSYDSTWSFTKCEITSSAF